MWVINSVIPMWSVQAAVFTAVLALSGVPESWSEVVTCKPVEQATAEQSLQKVYHLRKRNRASVLFSIPLRCPSHSRRESGASRNTTATWLVTCQAAGAPLHENKYAPIIGGIKGTARWLRY